MSLQAYREKRRFERTREPRAKRVTRAGSSFVIQKHAARTLHYDFRLELDGVLLSWAVPKGPSENPKEKRLAVQTEDHPVAYGSFAGTIPDGEYGAGTVEIWDHGSWQPLGDARQMYEAGHLHFELRGEKLHGAWHLVRTGNAQGATHRNKQSWLLFKGKDDKAKDDKAKSDKAKSDKAKSDKAKSDKAKSDQLKSDEPRVSAKGAHARRAAKAAPADGAVARASLPEVELQRATLVREVPNGDDYLHELKYDGYRCQGRLQDGEARLLTRYGHDWTARFEAIARAVAELPVRSAIFDGEVIAASGRAAGDFQKLQNAMKSGANAELRYAIFDLLYLDGWDLRGVPLEQRKQLLAELLAKRAEPSPLLLSRHVVGGGQAFFEQGRSLGLEGIVSKRRSALYAAAHKHDWLKIKYAARQEFVVVGFTPPGGARAHFGALLLGLYEAGELRYAGKVGSGFNADSLREIAARMKPLAARECPLTKPLKPAEARGVHWLKPELVAEVEFSELTADGRARHPTFKGLRDDKPAAAITPEIPEASPEPKSERRPKSSTKAAPPEEHPTFALSHPEKLLYPSAGYTKADLASYYIAVARWMLPYVAGRPLTLVRCPNGCDEPCFFQKHASGEPPPGVELVSLPEKRGHAEYMVIEDLRGLLALVQLGALEIHTWGAQAAQPNRPDMLVLDLDPDEGLPFDAVARAALETRQLLGERKLESFVKTTGGKGLHVCVPLDARADFEQAKELARSVADALVARAPDRYVATMSKSKRSGKVFVDYLRNARGATFVAPYSTRARPAASVAMPLHWDELDVREMPLYTLESAPRRLAQLKRDPWQRMLTLHQALPSAVAR